MQSPNVRAIIACVGFFLITLDASIVNVALPAIGSQLASGVTGLQWTVDGYTLALAGLIVIAGAAADRLGAARVFRWGLVGFGVTSAICATAPNAAILVAARVLQGVTGAAVLPTSMAVVSSAYSEPQARQKALGWWAAGGGVAVAAGPVLGGVLVDTLGWRSIFFVNVPIALIAAVIVRGGAKPAGPVRRWDVLGQTLLIVALVCGIYVLIEGSSRLFEPSVLLAAGLFGAALIAVVFRARQGSPAIPLDQLRRRGVSLAVGTGAILNITFFGVVFALSLTLQQHFGLSAWQTGLVLLPASAIIIVANLASNTSINKIGAYCTLAAGLSCEAIGFGLAAVVAACQPAMIGWWMAAALIPAGAGAGIASPAMMSVLMGATDADHAGAMAGFLNAGRQAGTAFGVAAAGIAVVVSGSVSGTVGYCAFSFVALGFNSAAAMSRARHRDRVMAGGRAQSATAS